MVVREAPNLPRFVTLTGVDAWTDLARLAELAERHPVEVAVLASRAGAGDPARPRYPSFERIEEVKGSFAAGPARLAIHLCGALAREVAAGDDDVSLEALVSGFDRCQVNLGPGPRDAATVGRVAAFADRCMARAVLQCAGPFPDNDRVSWLHDLSGGLGRRPEAWPDRVPGRLVGYAGGIDPGNAAATVAAIAARSSGDLGRRPDAWLDKVPGRLVGHAGGFWIDMETGLRTGDRLDLDKCEALLGAVYGEGVDRAPTA